jgi:hypothetical protein
MISSSSVELLLDAAVAGVVSDAVSACADIEYVELKLMSAADDSSAS